MTRLPGWVSGRPETNSILTTSIWANHSDEPGFSSASFYASRCDGIAYRWQLDHGMAPATTRQTDAYNLTISDIHTYYVLADTTPVLVHNCGGPVRLSDDVINTHILPRHGSGSPATGTKFHESIDPDDFETLANQAVRGAPVPSMTDTVTGNHAHDFDFGPGTVIGENGSTRLRVWVDEAGNVTTMHPL